MNTFRSVSLRAKTTHPRSVGGRRLQLASSYLSKSLRTLLLIVLALLLLAVAMAVAAGVAAVISRVERNAWRERHTEAAQGSALTLSLFLDRTQQTLINVSLLEPDDVGQGSSAMQKVLEQERSTGLLEVVRLESGGEILGSAFLDSPVLANTSTIGDSDWFQTARAGETYMNYIQVSSGAPSFLVISVPGPEQGVVAGRQDMGVLGKLLADLTFGRTGRTYIVDNSGRIVAHPDTATIPSGTSLEAHPEFVAFNQGDNTEWNGTYSNFQDVNVRGMMTRLPGTGWILVTEIATSEVHEVFRLMLLVMGIIALVAGIAALLVASRVLKRLLFHPLEQLSSSAGRISQGHLNPQPPIPWYSEFGQILSSLQAMASRLGERDRQIAARTDALSAEIGERQRVEEEVRHHAARAEALVRTSARLNALLDHDTIIKMICEETRSALGTDAASVSLYDASQDRYYHAADVGLPPTYNDLVQPVPRSRAERLIAQTAEHFPSRPQDKLLIRTDVLADPDDPNHEVNIKFGVRSVISTAMINEDEVVGRITAHIMHEPHDFTAADVALLQGIAHQGAQAIRNARLFAHNNRRLRQLNALHDIDKAITGGNELSVILGVVVAQVVEQLQIDAVDILLYDPETNELSYATGTGFRHKAIEQRRQRLGEGVAGRAAAERRICHIMDLAETDAFLHTPLLREEEFISYFGVPLVAQEQLIGVMELFHRSALEPEPEWLSFLEALVLQAAIGIEHVYLFSETRRLLQQTQEQARQMAQIMDTVPEGMLYLSREYRILLANPAANLYLPLLAPTVTNDVTNSVLTHLGGQPVERILASGGADTPWQDLVVEEEQRTFELAARPLRVNGGIEGWVVLVRDVTQERQRQEAVQIRERLATVGQFAAGIAHDFNNILAVIILYSQLVQRAPDLSAKQQQQLTTIYQQASHASDLIQQILDFSRQSVMERHPLDLGSFVKRLVKLWQRVLPETITLSLVSEPRQYTVNVDPTRLQQALMNLVINAKDAMSSGGTLTLRLTYERITPDQTPPLPEMPAGLWVCLAISDTGSGIPTEGVARIFEHFYTTKAPGKGTGLGLAQVHGIITQHDGYIGVESRLGQGSTFTLYLPTAEQEIAQDLAAERPTRMAATGETILLVEDNEAARDAIQHGLESLGYRVLTASDGGVALEVLRQTETKVDLVLSDLVMPDMGGLDLYRTIQVEEMAVKMILMTGYPLRADGRQLLNEENVTWLQKPVNLERLASVLEDALYSDEENLRL